MLTIQQQELTQSISEHHKFETLIEATTIIIILPLYPQGIFRQHYNHH